KQVVYPVKEDVKHRYTEETVRHVHPSHTTFVNNHTIRNEHVYPHTTSYETIVEEVDVKGINDRSDNSCRNVRGVREDRYHDKCKIGDARSCGCRGQCSCRRRRRRSWI